MNIRIEFVSEILPELGELFTLENNFKAGAEQVARREVSQRLL